MYLKDKSPFLLNKVDVVKEIDRLVFFSRGKMYFFYLFFKPQDKLNSWAACGSHKTRKRFCLETSSRNKAN